MKKKVVVSLVVICLALVIAGYGRKKIFLPSQGPITSKIVILNHRLEIEYSDWMGSWKNEIKGEIRNDNKQACTARVYADFYNYDNEVECSSIDWVGEMRPGEVWPFSIDYWGKRIKNYRLWIDGIF